MLSFKEAYYMGKHRSAAWHADGGANDEGHSGSRFREVHKVTINGRHWKTFGSHSDAKRAHDAVKKKYPDKSVSMHRTYVESVDMCNVCGQTPCNCTHIEEQNITELSSDLLQRYKDEAMKSVDKLTSKGKHKEANDRLLAHMKATGKQIEKTTAEIRKAVGK
jgi:hypothetical protein